MLAFDVVIQLCNQWRQLGNGGALPLCASQIILIRYHSQVEIDQRRRLANQFLPMVRLGTDDIVRILAIGHRDDAKIGAQSDSQIRIVAE